MTQEIQTSGLESSPSDDILNSRIPDVADREDHRGRGSSDDPKVMGQTKDRPVVADGAEICVERVGELSVADELRTDGNIGAGLERRADGLVTRIRCEIVQKSMSLTFGVE